MRDARLVPKGPRTAELPNNSNWANDTNTEPHLTRALPYSCHSSHSAVPAVRGPVPRSFPTRHEPENTPGATVAWVVPGNGFVTTRGINQKAATKWVNHVLVSAPG